MNQLKEHLLARKGFSQSELDFILSRFKKEHHQKGEILFSLGNICRKIYYIEAGVLRSYLHTEEGKSKVILFGFEDWWITDIDSFSNGTPSQINIDVLENCTLFSLNKSNFEILINALPAFESVFRVMMQKSYIREQRRSLELITNSSKDRYLKLIQRYPEIEQKVSQKNIASYIGVSPEFLSSMKKKIKIYLKTSRCHYI